MDELKLVVEVLRGHWRRHECSLVIEELKTTVVLLLVSTMDEENDPLNKGGIIPSMISSQPLGHSRRNSKAIPARKGLYQPHW